MSQKLRNIAIIAHVDHGKTTLVDKMLIAGELFKDHEKPGELMMDSNDLEKERGITILSKNVSVEWKGLKINIIDTPGHSDFGGEVERVLNMADGCLLLVDAFEGPMPQTRFVLQKAIELGLKPVVVVNKVDKPNCKPDEAQEAVFDLMFNLGATEEQLDFHTVFGSAKMGWMGEDWQKPTEDIHYLLDTIVEQIPEPQVEEGALQMQITSLNYNNYVGRIAIGRVKRGEIKAGSMINVMHRDGKVSKQKVKELQVFSGFGKINVDSAPAGEICAIIGLEKFEIGDTIADMENPEALPQIKIDEPTMSMLFTINNSPFFGQEGKFVTSRHIKDRLDLELQKNLALRVEPTDSADQFLVFGRGVLHLAVLIETMRREGYELQIGQPRVIIKEIDGQKCEPVEELTVDVPEDFSGKVIEMATKRKGEMLQMNPKGDRMVMEFTIPSRGLIGMRNHLLTTTQGEAIMSHRFKAFEPWKGDMVSRINGSMISMETGEAIPFSIFNLQERGKFFVNPNEKIYEGQVVGEHSKPGDLVINLTKTKKLTNIRASGTDDKITIVPAIKHSLEEALEYLGEDEYVEVTPESLRLRKIILKESDRKRSANKALADVKF